MKEKLSEILQFIKDFWKKTSKKLRIIYLVSAVVILGVSLATVLLLNRSDYIILQQDLAAEDNAAVIATLQEMNVPYVLEANKLMIPKEQENNVRMQLATKGYSKSGFDYSTFTNGTSFTATQYDKEKWTMFQLQERLQATIETFPQVQTAVVTLSIPEKNAYVLQDEITDTKASIKIQTKPGQELTAQQIQGIINIVKNSVPGLKDENIAISDQNGDLRTVLNNGQQAAASKLALTEEVNNNVKRRIMSMLSPVYGDDKVSVAVNSVLDTDQKVTESNRYEPLDPENPTRNPIDYQEIAREKTGQEGFAQGVPGANNNIDVPQYATPDQEMQNADYYSAHDVYDYLVSSVKEQIVKEGLEIKDLTVAVLIDTNAMSQGDRDVVIDTVAKTAGILPEKVSVQSLPFNIAEQPAPPPLEDPQMRRILLISGIGAAIVAILVATVLILLARRKKAMLAAEGEIFDEEQTTLLDLLNHEEEFEPITIPENPEQKLKAQIRDLANTDPEIVAQLIKTWLLGA